MSKPPPNTSGRPPAVAPPRPPKAASAAGSPVRPAVVVVPAARLDISAMTQLNALAARLNTLDYFQLLNVATSATPPEIKAAFHRWSRAFHPDRFYQVADKELKQRVNEVYKRITEAYYVLRDDVKRKAYLSDISSPERAKKLRFTEAAELETKAAVRKEQEEQIGTHPKGRQFFQAGMADFDAQKWAAAERNFKMALTFEPANPRYKEKLAEAQERNYQESKKAGEPFKIR
jgi:DnaJ-class molecular chaperone